MTTNLLKQAFEKASELPEYEQDAIAEYLIRTIESDAQRWEAAFARAPGKLEQLAQEALEEYRAGCTEPTRSRQALKSRTTAQFRKALGALPAPIGALARRAYNNSNKTPTLPDSSPNQ